MIVQACIPPENLLLPQASVLSSLHQLFNGLCQQVDKAQPTTIQVYRSLTAI